jgi:hypothetical protein
MDEDAGASGMKLAGNSCRQKLCRPAKIGKSIKQIKSQTVNNKKSNKNSQTKIINQQSTTTKIKVNKIKLLLNN